MVIERVLVALPAVLEAVSLTVNVPDAVGVPVILPALEHDSPEGSPVAVHVMGGVPVAVRVAEYDSFTYPSIKPVIDTDGGTFTVIVRFL